jgi:tRNA synthetase class II (A)
MTLKLYLEDPYVRTFEAEVLRSSDDACVLSRTGFYPGGGGQPADRGWLSQGAERLSVEEVREESEEEIWHRVGRELAAGTVVRGELEWPWRHGLMRAHTLMHAVNTVAGYVRDVAHDLVALRVAAGEVFESRVALTAPGEGDRDVDRSALAVSRNERVAQPLRLRRIPQQVLRHRAHAQPKRALRRIFDGAQRRGRFTAQELDGRKVPQRPLVPRRDVQCAPESALAPVEVACAVAQESEPVPRGTRQGIDADAFVCVGDGLLEVAMSGSNRGRAPPRWWCGWARMPRRPPGAARTRARS